MNIGRNDPCHCGSGKKYKKCCMEADRTRAVAARTPAPAITVTTAVQQEIAAPPTRVHCKESGVTVEVGRTYVISPANPKKLKHRDRTVTVLGFTPDEDGRITRVDVKFTDTNRKGRVDLEDLAPVAG